MAIVDVLLALARLLRIIFYAVKPVQDALAFVVLDAPLLPQEISTRCQTNLLPWISAHSLVHLAPQTMQQRPTTFNSALVRFELCSCVAQ